MELILERTLKLDAITEQSEFSTRNPASLKRAKEQAAIFRTLNWTQEEIDIVLDLTEYIDLLNIKYLYEYDFAPVDLDVIAGLKLTQDRAIGAVAYGLLDHLYDHFVDRPEVYQAVFGVQMGRLLFEHSRDMSGIVADIEHWRQSPEAQPEIEERVRIVEAVQTKLATALGMPDDIIDKVNRDLLEDRLTGAPINLDELRNDLTVSGGETLNERIREGRDLYESGLYLSRAELEHLDDTEQRRDILKALERAKQLDRAKAVLYEEWRKQHEGKARSEDTSSETPVDGADLSVYDDHDQP